MDTIELLAHFLERGYVVLPGALDGDSVDRFWDEVETQIEHNPELTFAMYGQLLKNRDVQGRVMQNREVLRIIDLEDHVQRARPDAGAAGGGLPVGLLRRGAIRHSDADLQVQQPAGRALGPASGQPADGGGLLLPRIAGRGLVHAGGQILDLHSTRKSFVVHYARVPESMLSPSPSEVKQRHLGGWLYANAGG